VQHAELESAYACAALRYACLLVHDKSSRTEDSSNLTGVRNEIVKDGNPGCSRLVTLVRVIGYLSLCGETISEWAGKHDHAQGT
jgi:hypothetical protein